jgi:ABC-type sugar transport system permease subunit
MSAQGWTPAIKQGLVPLHPLQFGALLGKPFAALRHNPKVLFGFAIVIQLIVAVVTLVVVGGVAIASFLRLESLSPSNPSFLPVMWGTIAINALTVLAMGFISVAFTAIMQGVVAADIGYAALGEKAKLKKLWQRMKPAFWRLVGWSVVQMLAAIVLMIVVGGIIALGVMAGVGGSGEGVAVTVVIGILVVLAAIPLWVWLSTKLLLVPSVLVLEQASLREALVRSWRLTRGRFWNTFAVILLIGHLPHRNERHFGDCSDDHRHDRAAIARIRFAGCCHRRAVRGRRIHLSGLPHAVRRPRSQPDQLSRTP